MIFYGTFTKNKAQKVTSLSNQFSFWKSVSILTLFRMGEGGKKPLYQFFLL